MKFILPAISALSLSACVGTGIATTTDTVTVNKDATVTSCVGLTGVSAEHSRSVAGLPFRCGPQTQIPVTYK